MLRYSSSSTEAHRQVVPVRSRLLRGVVAVSLAASMTVSVPVAASADEQEATIDAATAAVVQSWKDALSASESPDYSAYSSSSEEAALASEAASGTDAAKSFPASFDLRDPNGDGDTSDSVVTPVKQQNPFNTCWSFGATAASESSILSELGKTYAETGLDLSELYLAWFAYTPVPESYAGAAQAGEGYHAGGEHAATRGALNVGGYPFYATNLFSSGVGPVSESVAPYKNHQDVMTCSVAKPGETKTEKKNLTASEVADLRAQGYTVNPLYYAYDDWGTTKFVWGLDESLYGQSEYTLEESYILPDLRTYNERGGYAGVNQEGVNAVKTQLLAGRGVAADSLVDQATPEYKQYAKYINLDTWAVYATGTLETTNKGDLHAYAIVGWDDNFSKDNFLAVDGTTPNGNGAWLVKNSWGASTNDFPNHGDWGIKDADGNNTGYFWISYYDQTIRNLEAFNYDVGTSTSNEKFDYDQYNYIATADSTVTHSSEKPLYCANEFTASDDRVMRALTCETAKPNTDVTYELYLLDSDDAQPTDGKLVLTKSAHYDYGGYHRLMLDAADQIPMRAGQRYAVVVTQKCASDGKYYQIVSRADNSNYTSQVGSVTAKVNAGESWVSYDGQWYDWKPISEMMTLDTTYVVDNFAIKGLSKVHDWASVEELALLDEAISEAKGVLAAAQVSADGSDVYACDTWMTQAEHDAAAAAVEAAEKAIAAAGDYRNELANTTPSPDEVAAAEKALVLEAKRGSKAVPTFPDVDYTEGSWYADGVSWCAAHELVLGYPSGLFGVGDTVQRAQLATILWRHFEPEAAAGYDAVMPEAKGTDAVDGVEDAQYYTAAANWAVASGVIQGFEQEGSAKRDFAPYGEVSFEQLVSIVAKASGADYESSDLSVLDGFADKDAVSGWAAHAMAWAVEEGLVSGWDNGDGAARTLDPGATVARERAAVVLSNAFRAGVLK